MVKPQNRTSQRYLTPAFIFYNEKTKSKMFMFRRSRDSLHQWGATILDEWPRMEWAILNEERKYWISLVLRLCWISFSRTLNLVKVSLFQFIKLIVLCFNTGWFGLSQGLIKYLKKTLCLTDVVCQSSIFFLIFFTFITFYNWLIIQLHHLHFKFQFYFKFIEF